MPDGTPTLKDISAKTGYGLSTVSLALRKPEALKPKTVAAIRQAADELGYRPNPMVSALMTQVRTRRSQAGQTTLGLISLFGKPGQHGQFSNAYYSLIYRALEQAADATGYRVDEFFLGKEPLSGARLTQILKTRGIRGIILFPGRDDGLTVYPELDWSAFSTVLIGYNPLLTHFNQVVSDYYYDIDCALRKVDEAGLKRVGFAITRRVDDHTNQRWASRFLYFQQRTPKRDQVPVLISETDLEHREAVAPWYFKHRPEVILVAGSGVQGNLQDAGVRVPEDVRLINLVQRDEPEMAGINPFTEELGRAAIEQLASQLQSNQVGLPAYPAVISIKGVWSPGASFPESKTFAV